MDRLREIQIDRQINGITDRLADYETYKPNRQTDKWTNRQTY